MDGIKNNLPSNISWTVHDICETSKRFIIGAGANSFFYVLDKGTSEWKDKKITYNGRDYPVPTALIAFDDVVLAGTRLGIFRSYDHGETWDSVGIRALPLGTVSFARNGNRIYAGLTNMSDFWVWYTDDSGDTWNILDHQFASLNQIYYYDNRLWAATNSGAMISGLLTDVNPEEPSSPGGFTLEQNFPNPFNPATTIRYSLNSQDAAHVILKVYDVLGNEITTLVNEEKQPGSYFVNYNAASLASGVYYYTVYITGTTGSVTISQKMIVMK